MADKKGIDISRYQGKPDFGKLKTEVDFVILQAGFGRYSSQKDAEFERGYAECKKHGIPCGAYWFSYAQTTDEARQEAKACMDVIAGKSFEYPIYYDIEGSACSGDVYGKCKAFCGELEKAKYFAGIYISRSPAQQYLPADVGDKYALWLAEYGGRLNWQGSVGMWQNSSTGRFGGIFGDVDMNYCYVDYPALITEGGFNGFEKPAGPDALDYSGYAEGDKGLGVLAYKQMLRYLRDKGIITQKLDNNGSFGPGTTKATNEFLGILGNNQNGIAGANTIKALGEKIKEV